MKFVSSLWGAAAAAACMFIVAGAYAAPTKPCEESLLGATVTKPADEIIVEDAIASDAGLKGKEEIDAGIVESLRDIEAELSDAKNPATESELKELTRRTLMERLVDKLSAVKGGCLRGNKVALANYIKTMVSVWAFQLTGYAMASMGSSQQHDFPFDVLSSTAFIIWIQQELACRTSAPQGKPQKAKTFGDLLNKLAYGENGTFKSAARSYARNVGRRYLSYMSTLPIGILSFTLAAWLEDAIRKALEGAESTRPPVLSREAFKSATSDAVMSFAYNSFWLFPRFSTVGVPLELKFFPMLHTFVENNLNGKVIAVGSEWAYRIGLGLLDNWIFFKVRQGGIDIEGYVSFHPDEISEGFVEEFIPLK